MRISRFGRWLGEFGEQIVAFALPHNKASRGVMEHCGFTYQHDFTHAGLPHVMYVLNASDFPRKKS